MIPQSPILNLVNPNMLSKDQNQTSIRIRGRGYGVGCGSGVGDCNAGGGRPQSRFNYKSGHGNQPPPPQFLTPPSFDDSTASIDDSTASIDDSTVDPILNLLNPNMLLKDQIQTSIHFNYQPPPPRILPAPRIDDSTPSIVDWIIDWILGLTDANATAPPSAMPQIPKVPITMREKHEDYYVPKVVSIGPYHFGNEKLRLLEQRKPIYAMKLLEGNRVALGRLYEKLVKQEMVKELKSFYEEDVTNQYSDEDFTKMMLLDSCFVLYFINFNGEGGAEESSELKSNEIFFVRRDLFLLENQVPLIALKKVIGSINAAWLRRIKPFIDSNCLIMFSNFKKCGRNESEILDDKIPHLLGAVHAEHSMKTMNSKGTVVPDPRVNFRNVSELLEVGMHFKPIKDTRSWTHIEFVKGCLGFSATVKLPSITVDDYTKPMLLNLIAYEMCNCSINDSWVTSYVCLLDSLIDDAEDVKVLRKAWVLENFLSCDKEVAELFNEIAKDLVPSSIAYAEAKEKMQAHYRTTRNTHFCQLKNQYFKSPWAIFALLGALMALFLTGVQTYFTIWDPKRT